MKLKLLTYITILITLFILVVCNNTGSKKVEAIDLKSIATIKNSVVSDTGNYELKVFEVVIEGTKHNKFTISKLTNDALESELLFTSIDAFRTSDNLYFMWDSEDRVWVYSGDVGTYFWEHTGDNEWKKFAYVDNRNIPVPELLKKLKPKDFQ